MRPRSLTLAALAALALFTLPLAFGDAPEPPPEPSTPPAGDGEAKPRGLLQKAGGAISGATHDVGSAASKASHQIQAGAAKESHKLQSDAAKASHTLQSNVAKESHTLQSNAAKESHKLQADLAKASHTLQSSASKKVVHFNHWWNDKVMGGDARRHRMMERARENGRYAEELYEADRRSGLAALGWTPTQIDILEQLYRPQGSFRSTEYAALYDVLYGASYGQIVDAHVRSGKPFTDTEVAHLHVAARQHALGMWGRYYGISMAGRTDSLRLDDDDDGTVTSSGTNASVSGSTNSTTTVDSQSGATRIDFGDGGSVIGGSGSGGGGNSGSSGNGGNGSGGNEGNGNGGNGGNGNGTKGGGGAGGNSGSIDHTPSSGGSTRNDPRDTSYQNWSRERFGREYRQFGTKLKEQLASLEEGTGKLWIRYGDKVRDFARDKVKEKVKTALGKLPGGNTAVKAMGVFNDLMVTRQELASAPTLKKHPNAKLVSSFSDMDKPDKFLEGFFAGPTDIRAIELSQKGYTAWKSATGEWFYDRNPRLSPSDYQTIILPHGNPTPGTAQPVGIPDKVILAHYFQKVVKEKLHRIRNPLIPPGLRCRNSTRWSGFQVSVPNQPAVAQSRSEQPT